MAAHEHQPQDVVAIVGSIEPLGRGGFRVGEIGDQILRRQRRLGTRTTHRIDAGIARHHDQPGRCVARRAVARPRPERAQTGFLECLLRRVEVAEVAQQRGDRLRSRRRQHAADPGAIRHDTAFAPAARGGASNRTPTGRSS